MHDLKLTIRQLIKSPGFTAVAVLTLALGIGACTTMFSLADAVLLRPLPFREPERLVWMQNEEEGTTLSDWTLRVDSFLDYRAQAESFESLAAYHAFFEYRRYSLSGGDEPRRLRGIQISQNFLDVLGVQPLLGRSFVAEECVWNGRPAAILTHRLWQQQFGGAADIVDRAVTINGSSVTIVGVLPPSAHLDLLFGPGTNVDVLLPFPLTPETARQGNTLFAIGRLKADATLAQAQEELAVINTRLLEAHPDRNGGFFGVRIAALEDHVRGHVRPAFLLLSGAVLCVLLIACVNLSNLLLARTTARRHEWSVRIAAGASRWRLARQAMTESLVLAFAGCALGVLGCSFVIAAISRVEAFGIPLLQSASIDGAALLASVALAGLAALLCSLLPAWHLGQRQASEALKDGGSRSGAGKGAVWIRRTLVVSEVALACVLLVGAGLLVRSFVNVLQVDLGFQPEHTLAMRVDSPRSFDSYQERSQYYNRLAERIAVVPGVEAVGLNDSQPLGFRRAWAVRAKGVTYERGQRPFAYVRMVDHRCLQTMRIPLRGGRYFDASDSDQSPQVTIVSETLAQRLWPDENPIGQAIVLYGEHPEYTVVGVVSDVAHGLEDAPQPDLYLNIQQVTDWAMLELVVRTRRAPAALVPDVRAAITSFDPALPTNEFTTLEQIVDRALAPRRFVMGLLGSFSSFALLLAVIGLYGTIAYSVGQRTREIGIRLAVGAQRGDVLRLILGEGLKLAGVGVGLGLIAALALTRVLQGQLFGVTATDPATFAGNAALLIAVALLASFLPARRATRVNPVEALRAE